MLLLPLTLPRRWLLGLVMISYPVTCSTLLSTRQARLGIGTSSEENSLSVGPNLIIGGFGDSGTRGVKVMMEALGLRMCSNIFENTGDNVATAFGIRYDVTERLEAVLAKSTGNMSVEAYRGNRTNFKSLLAIQKEAVEETRKCVSKDLHDRTRTRRGKEHGLHWGFKNPWQLVMWPISRHIFGKGTKLLSVVRDPRDTCTSRGDRSIETHLCAPVLGRPCSGEKDCYSFWAKFHYNLLDEYASSGDLKLVRIEDLVLPEPDSKQVRATTKCVLDFAGLATSQAPVMDALQGLHMHRDAYMGHHYGANWMNRLVRTSLTRYHEDPLVKDMMLRFGYSPSAFKLLKPTTDTLC